MNFRVFTVRDTKIGILGHLELFSGRLPVKIVKTLNERQSTLLAESLWSFLDKSRNWEEESGKRKEKRGRRKEERGKRKEERGKRKEEKGKRKEERGKRKEERGSWEKLQVSLNMVVFWAQGKSNARLEICKAFQDRLTFLNRHMIVWIGRDS